MTAPANDALANAAAAGAGTTQMVLDTAGATVQSGEGGSAARTVWVTWRCPTAGLVTMTTAGSSFDTVLAVWSGPAGADPVTNPSLLTLVAQDDDSGPGATSSVTFDGTLGKLYYVQVGGYEGDDQGTAVLNYPTPLSLPDPTDLDGEGTAFTVVSSSTSQQWDLKSPDDGMVLLPGAIGLRLPPVEMLAYEVPGRAGAAAAGVKVAPKDVVLPMCWWATTRAELVARRRAFDSAMFRDVYALRRDPRAPLTAVVVTEHGDRPRVIRGAYIGGMSGDEGTDSAGLNWEKWAMTLRCPSPFWRALEPERLEWTFDAAGTAFFPILPLTLSDASVFGATVVAVSGDVETWPRWTITGPCTSVQATGPYGTWRLEYAIPAGRYVVLDTDPAAPAVTLDDGTNLFPYLASDDLWSLSPGVQEITVTADDASDDTVISAEFYPTWVTA